MNVLIFGASGFIGKNLTKELTSAGHQVLIAIRDKNNNTYPLSDIHDSGEIDAVINLAGESIGNRRWSAAVKREILDSRIRTTRAIVSAINEGVLKPKVLINASATGYYGPRADEKLTENEGPGRDFLAEVCQAWEREAYKAQSASIRVVTIRTGVVLGSEGALKRMAMPFQFYLGGPLGSGEQWLSWIHIDDLIKIYKFALVHDEIAGPVNGTAPNPLKMKDFAKVLGEVLHKPSWFPVPAFMLKIALGQMSEMLLHGQRVIPAKILAAGFVFQYQDVRSALTNALTSS